MVEPETVMVSPAARAKLPPLPDWLKLAVLKDPVPFDVLSVPEVLVTDTALKTAPFAARVGALAVPLNTTVPPLAAKVCSVVLPSKADVELEAVSEPISKLPAKLRAPEPAVMVPAFPAVVFVLPATVSAFAPELRLARSRVVPEADSREPARVTFPEASTVCAVPESEIL